MTGFILPYKILMDYLKKGKPVWDGHCNKYIATIFSKRNHIMLVENGNGVPFIIEDYKHSNYLIYFKSLFEKE